MTPAPLNPIPIVPTVTVRHPAGRDPIGHLPGPMRVAIWMTLAGLAFSAMGGLIKFAARDLHPFEVAFFRCFFGLVWMVPWLLRRGPSALRTAKLPLYVARAVIGLIGMLAGFYALRYIALADATALSFTAPLFATVGAAVVLRETVRRRRWTATVLGFVGVLIILRPGVTAVDPAALWTLLAAATTAANVLIVKRLTDTEPTEAVVTWMVVMMTPMTLLAALPFWETPSPTQLGIMAAIGLCGTLGHLAVTRGFAAGEASLVMSFDYLKMPFAAVIGWLAFGELPTPWTFLGAAVIAGSAAYIAHREAALARAPAGRRAAGESDDQSAS
ncbi:DMT family transporter [Thalassobaculum sp.]|uniref:DMT family transporter n=1 Tax=Thalassobaculum sp. TaxID=2022740 RepID=UPI0032EB212C